MGVRAGQPEQRFLDAFGGSFTSTLRWHHLDGLWQTLRGRDMEGWYIYAVGEAPPAECANRLQLDRFIYEIDRLLRSEHQEEYCGIVYADDLANPRFIKIYDPNNLGVSCGFSDNPPLPGWVLSRLPPCDLRSVTILSGNRRRWWQRLFDR